VLRSGEAAEAVAQVVTAGVGGDGNRQEGPGLEELTDRLGDPG
jgi:hypothetical protein